MKVLVVDDSRAIRMMLCRQLKDFGYDVFEAKEGNDALNQLKALGAVDLVMVDWNMPVMDGLSFVKAARSNPEYEAMKIMMVTSEAEGSYMASALTEGANEYITKPFSAESLREKIDLVMLGGFL